MQWSDRAIILSVRRLGENSGVVQLLTPENGMYAGVDRGAFSKRQRGIYQPGNIVAASWKARLSEHLGMVSCELTDAVAAKLLDSRHKLSALTSAAMLAEKMLEERDPQPVVFERLEELVHALCANGDWLAAYVRFEMTLLACSGFGLDLARCASTGQTHDLIYVSPKSGCAVSRAAGEPYRDRLFSLPAFLARQEDPLPLRPGSNALAGENDEMALISVDNIVVPLPQILDGLRLCGYFLGQRVFTPRGIPIPGARARFVKVLQPPEGTLVGEDPL